MSRSPEVAVIESIEYCDGSVDTGLRDKIDWQRQSLDQALGRLGLASRPIPEPSRDKLHALVEQWRDVPFILIYTGHGVTEAGADGAVKSLLCLKDRQKVAVEELLSRIPGRVPYAVWILDGCRTAGVDVRKSLIPAAVLSAGPNDVKGAGTTALGGLLPAALASGDKNCDGRLTDSEVLDYLLLHRDTSKEGAIMPKLRRQSWIDLPLGLAAMPTCEAALTPKFVASLRALDSSSAVLAREDSIRRGAIAEAARTPSIVFLPDRGLAAEAGLRTGIPDDLGDTAATLARALVGSELLRLVAVGDDVQMSRLRDGTYLGGVARAQVRVAVERALAGKLARKMENEEGTFVWHPGWASGETMVTPDGQDFSTATLVPVPCEEPFGQCFKVRQNTGGEL
jgi:hypothetical protein